MPDKLQSSKSELFKPGPGSYNIPSSLKVQNSLSKQSNEKRFKPYQTLVPGPGQYNTLLNSNVNGPKALILSRTKQHKNQTVPGPGSYEPDYKKIMKAQSGYQLPKGQRQSPTNKAQQKLPGPGSYQTAKSTLINDKHVALFSHERKIQLTNNNNVPGPGQYNTISNQTILHNQPKAIFSKGVRSQSYNSLAPGPGAYQVSESFETNPKKGFSISFRNKSGQYLEKNQNIPGPGSYQFDQIDKIKFKSSSFSVPKSPRMKIDNQKQLLMVPGPQKYNIKLSAFEHKSFKLGSSTRKGLQNKANIPGPGSYNVKDLTQMPKFSMPKSNKSWIKTSNVPGPGNYDPKVVSATQYQAVGINKDDRKPFYDQKKSIPGPGQYTITQMITKKNGYTVGHEKRSDLASSRERKPGPGEYNVVSRLKGQKNN